MSMNSLARLAVETVGHRGCCEQRPGGPGAFARDNDGLVSRAYERVVEMRCDLFCAADCVGPYSGERKADRQDRQTHVAPCRSKRASASRARRLKRSPVMPQLNRS